MLYILSIRPGRGWPEQHNRNNFGACRNLSPGCRGYSYFSPELFKRRKLSGLPKIDTRPLYAFVNPALVFDNSLLSPRTQLLINDSTVSLSTRSLATSIELLAEEYEIDIQPAKVRLRCAGHILNLVCKAMLYGTDSDCLDEACSDGDEELEDSDVVTGFDSALRASDELERLKAWRKKGPLGKLHNIVVHARSSSARRQLFREKQREACPDNRLFELVLNGGIRWQSDHDMIERALQLRDALELYQAHLRCELQADILTAVDWRELKDLGGLLAPIKRASKVVQSDQSTAKQGEHFYSDLERSSCGSLWQTLTAFDWLLTSLERAKAKHQHLPHSHLKAAINLAWKKLNKYYALSDCTAAYRAAIVLHPHYKMRWFEGKWAEDHSNWIDAAKDSVVELYNEYKARHTKAGTTEIADAPPAEQLDDYERSLYMDEDGGRLGDELERYLREEHAPARTNALAWWQQNEQRYPVLRELAFDLIAAPATSAAAERRFSEAGHVLDEGNWHTRSDLAEATQCLKSWFEQDMIKADTAVAIMQAGSDKDGFFRAESDDFEQ